MENKKTKNILLAVMGIIILIMLAIELMTLNNFAITTVLSIATLVFIALYGFVLYKKPHGNMLKYTMIILAINQMLRYSNYLSLGIIPEYVNILSLISAGILVYVSGRLNRIDQNKYLLIIALIIKVFVSVMSIMRDLSVLAIPLFAISYLYEPVAIFTLMIAYFVRYKEHKEAGVSDK